MSYQHISRQQLLDMFELYPDGSLMWKCSNYSGREAGWLQSFKDGHKRFRVQVLGYTVPRARIVFCMVHGYWPKEVDHINGRTSDDRPENLRAAEHQQNSWNRHGYRKKSSLPRGVVRATRGSFQAKIGLNGKTVYLGSFPTPEAAHSAYRSARQKHYGEFA